MQALLKVRFKLVQQSELKQMLTDVYLVSVLQQLARHHADAVKMGSISRSHIRYVIFDAPILGDKSADLCVLPGRDRVSEYDIRRGAAADYGGVICKGHRQAQALPLYNNQDGPPKPWTNDFAQVEFYCTFGVAH